MNRSLYYAGLLAAQLAPVTKETIGVDISQGMIDFFDEKAKKLGFASGKMRGFCQELKLDGEELDGKRFDLVIVGINHTRRHKNDHTYICPRSAAWHIIISPISMP